MTSPLFLDFSSNGKNLQYSLLAQVSRRGGVNSGHFFVDALGVDSNSPSESFFRLDDLKTTAPPESEREFNVSSTSVMIVYKLLTKVVSLSLSLSLFVSLTHSLFLFLSLSLFSFLLSLYLLLLSPSLFLSLSLLISLSFFLPLLLFWLSLSMCLHFISPIQISS